MGNDLALHYSKVLMGQVIVLQYLTKTVVHAMRSEAGTQLLIDALLDVEDGALQPTSILFVKPCIPKDYNPPYRWETRTPLHALANRPLQLLGLSIISSVPHFTHLRPFPFPLYHLDLTGVLANLKTALSEKVTHCDSTLSSALQLCQAAMVILLCVPPYKGDIHLEARTIFTEFGITLRSMMTERINTRLTAAASGVSHVHQLHEDHTIREAEIAHACLSALSAHDYYENRNKIPESNSIFPDDLVEILMELNTSQSRGLPTSSLRRRRIKDKWTTLALEHIRELWPDTPEAEADTIGCTNVVDAGELRFDKDSRINSRVHVDLGNSRSTKVDSVHMYSALEPTHGETGHGHDIADDAEMPGADRDSFVNSISAD